MPEDNTDVTRSSGSSTDDEPVGDNTGADSSTVTPDVEPEDNAVVPEGGDRPFLNYQAETNRKVARLERMVSDLVGAIATGQVGMGAAANTAPDQPRQYSDDELLELMSAGNKEAGEAFVQRQVDKRLSTTHAVNREAQIIAAQLQVLYNKYPILNDPNHPLTQAAMLAKQALMSQFGRTNTQATDLEAIKVAIADNPEIIADTIGRSTSADASEGARRSATRPQAGMQGATYRRSPSGGSKAPAVSAEEAKVAKRMGIKDPGKAKERFLKRQEEEKSSVSPTVAMIVNEQGGT